MKMLIQRELLKQCMNEHLDHVLFIGLSLEHFSLDQPRSEIERLSELP